MANRSLFKSLFGRLIPAANAVNEERAPAYALAPKHRLAQYAATGCLNSTFYADASAPATGSARSRRWNCREGSVIKNRTSLFSG